MDRTVLNSSVVQQIHNDSGRVCLSVRMFHLRNDSTDFSNVLYSWRRVLL